MLTVGALARRFGLSRSTLLYYDAIGLLRPSGRSTSNYRLYSEEDVERLRQICTFKEAGINLEAIAEILEEPDGRIVQTLEKRLDSLSKEIERLREQQRVVVRLLQCRTQLSEVHVLDKEQWVMILEAAGLTEEDQHRWHFEFERMAARAHRDFLAELGVSEEEIEQIRAWSRTYETD